MLYRRFLVVVLALALVAAACGDDDDTSADSSEATTSADDAAADSGDDEASDDAAADSGDDDAASDDAVDDDAGTADAATDDAADAGTDDGSEPADDVELTASFRGVTEDTITVGVSMLDFEFLVSNNLSPNGWGDQELVWQTFIDDLNANGGINGRQVEAVYKFYSPVGTAEAEGACLELTADTETFAVLGGFLGPAEVANACVTGPQNTIMVGGRQSPEQLAAATAPWIQSPAARDRRLDTFVELLDQDGRLEGKQVAVVGGRQAEEEYERAPEVLAEHGVEPVLVAFNDASSGGDQSAEDAQWEAISQRIITEGADTVFLIGSTAGGIRGISNAGLDVEVWVLDADALVNLGESVAPEQADGAITLSGLTDSESWEHPTVAKCREVFAAANPDIEVKGPDEVAEGEDRWYTPIMNYCRWLDLFVMVSASAGPDLTHDSFNAAVAAAGDFELPGIPFASLGAEKLDADDSFRLSEWDSSIGEKGGLSPLTEILDGTPQ